MAAKNLILAAIVALPVFSQTTFTLRNATTGDSPQQIRSILAGTGAYPSAKLDPATASITVSGTLSGLGLAQYLIGALDVTPATVGTKPAFAYTSPTGDPMIAHAIHLTNPSTQRSLMSVSQCLRSLDVQPLGPLSVDAIGMVVLHGSKNDVALGDWILQVLDRSTNTGASAEFSATGDGTVAHAFYPASMTTDFQILNTAKLLRDNPLLSNQVCQSDWPPTIIVRGTPAQIGVAGMDIQQQDEAAARHPVSVGLRPGWSQAVFMLRNATSGSSPREIMTLLNLVNGDLSASLDPNGLSLTVNGTPSGLALAHYLVGALDVAPATAATTQEYPYTSANHKQQVVRTFHIQNLNAQRSMLDIITYLRLFNGVGVATIGANGMAVVSGTENNVALGSWILQVLDRSSDAGAPTEFTIPGDPVEGGNTVHAFYPASITSIQQLAQLSKSMRDNLGIKHVFQSVSPSTIIVQGTADQIEKASEMIRQQAAAAIARH